MNHTKIVIDGNIGAGKTTQLDMLEKDGYSVKREPIDQWPLELFYSDPDRWGFLFQIIILQTLTLNQDDKPCIYERCPKSSLDVFWRLMKKNDVEDQAYKKAYEHYGWEPDVYIFIDTPPLQCKERIQMRTQDGDSGVSQEYLEKLYEAYMDMYDNMKCVKYKIDGTQTQDVIVKKIKQIINKYDNV